MRRLLIVNPAASAVTPALVARVERELTAGGPVEVVLTRQAGHATELAAAACDDHAVLYVLAGDGGFNEVVNGVRGPVAVGFLPGGATSVLPRALGLPRDPVACARRLARAGARRTISLGRATLSSPAGGPPVSRRFTFAAGIGLDAEVVRAVDRRGRRNGRRPGDAAFVAEAVRAIVRRRGRLEPALTLEGAGRCAFLVATNCDPYTYAGPVPVRVTPLARFELGLDFVAPVRLGPGGIATFLWSALWRPGSRPGPGILSGHDVDRLLVRCDEPTPLELDGEDLGDVTAVLLEAERGALTALV